MLHTWFNRSPIRAKSVFLTVFLGLWVLAPLQASEPRGGKTEPNIFWSGRVPHAFVELGIEQSGTNSGKVNFEGLQVEWVFLQKQNLQFHVKHEGRNRLSSPTQIVMSPGHDKVAFKGDITGDGKPELILMTRQDATKEQNTAVVRCAVFSFSDHGRLAQVVHLESVDHGMALFIDLNKNGDLEWVHAPLSSEPAGEKQKVGALWFTSTLDQATPLQLSKEMQQQFPNITGGLRYDREYATFGSYQGRR